MSSVFRTYQPEIYQQFHEIEETAYHDMVKFYEKHALLIDQLDIEAYFEVKSTYGIALFEIGRYREFIDLSQGLLEGIIYHNIKLIHGEDLYEKLLLKRAAAHYQLLAYDEAEFILRQLIRMNPNNNVAVYLLKRTLIRNQPKSITNVKGVSILLFLTAAALIASELLIVRAFFPEWSDAMESLRNLVFGAGFLALAGADLYHRMISIRVSNRLLEDARADESVQQHA